MNSRLGQNWSFKNYTRWKKKDRKCFSGELQSPINIDTSNTIPCNSQCRLQMSYVPSKCHVSNNNKMVLLNYDSGSYIKFKSNIYELSKIAFHIPSLHTVNGENYDMEVVLYHCDETTVCKGGVAISIFLQRGHEYGPSENFISQFINQIPISETTEEKNILVDSDWNAKDLFPENKSFYYYEGSLPFPPCDESWTWILFEEASNIGKTNYETFKHNITSNIRVIQQLNGRALYYNTHYVEDDVPKINNNIDNNERKRLKIEDDQNNRMNSWYYKHKTKILGFLKTLIMVILVLASAKLAKHFIMSGKLNDFMSNMAKAAAEAAALTGGVVGATEEAGAAGAGNMPANQEMDPSMMGEMGEMGEMDPSMMGEMGEMDPSMMGEMGEGANQ